jgi:uroporphyrinogen decarboxylase
MAAEPSAFGCKVRFHHDRPPSIEPVVSDLSHWAKCAPVNPTDNGLMPLVLRLYQLMDQRLRTDGLGIRMVAARGPMTTASWVMGVTPLMKGLAKQPEEMSKFLDTITTSLIRWLEAQLETLQHPEGIMLLDDLVGMISPGIQTLVEPHLKRIPSLDCCMITRYALSAPVGKSGSGRIRRF